MRNAKDYMKRTQLLKITMDKGLSENTQKALSSRIKDADDPEKLAEEYTVLIENCRTEAEIIRKLNL